MSCVYVNYLYNEENLFLNLINTICFCFYHQTDVNTSDNTWESSLFARAKWEMKSWSWSSIRATFYFYLFITFLQTYKEDDVGWLCAQQIKQVILYFHNIPSDCNRTVIVCLSTLFTRLWFFDMFGLCTEQMWSCNWKGVIERLCWMEVLSVFSPRVWIKKNMHAQICVQSQEGSKHCVRAVTVYWKKLYFQSQLQQHGTTYLWYSSIVSTLHLTLTAYDNDNPLTDEWSWDHIQWSLWNPTSLLCSLLWSL